MIALLPAALAATAYLIWQSNRTAYDRNLLEQTKGHCTEACKRYTESIKDSEVR